MSKLKLVAGIIIFGLHGFHCTTMAQKPESQKNQIKNSTIKIQSTMNSINKFEFQALPYAYDALEPFIDKLTLEIHYGKHHKACLLYTSPSPRD